MEFDSHVNDTVLRTVALVNAVTPGLRGGRDVVVPRGDALVAAVEEILASGPPFDVAEARRLVTWAEQLRSIVELVEAGEVDEACEAVNGVLRETGARPELTRHDGRAWHLHYHAAGATAADHWAAPMATALAVVLGNPAIDRLGVCTAPACDRIFVDTSRNGTRRFCSTSCQNRVKAAAFRARRATPSPTA